MRLLTTPQYVYYPMHPGTNGAEHVPGAYHHDIPNIKIYAPRSPMERTFEKLRTGGDDGVLEVGMEFAQLVFNNDRLTLFNVAVIEECTDEIFVCSVGHFGYWDNQNKF